MNIHDLIESTLREVEAKLFEARRLAYSAEGDSDALLGAAYLKGKRDALRRLLFALTKT